MVRLVSLDCGGFDSDMVVRMIYDRKTGELVLEKTFEDRKMRFLYGTTLGGLCLFFLRLPLVSRVYGFFQKTGRSQKKIQKLISDYQIETEGLDSDGQGGTYESFNAFIARKTEHHFDPTPNNLISTAESCVLVSTIHNGLLFSIKGKSYTLADFLKDEALASVFEGGTCLIFRLRAYDYHRFCFVDDGTILSHKRIRGFLDSINTQATGRFTLSSNYREITLVDTKHFGEIIHVEVGAMLVGRIVTTHSEKSFRKGDEKGFFEFGGSTIVLLIKEGVVTIDKDILAHSAQGVETKVSLGEKIGIRCA